MNFLKEDQKKKNISMIYESNLLTQFLIKILLDSHLNFQKYPSS